MCHATGLNHYLHPSISKSPFGISENIPNPKREKLTKCLKSFRNGFLISKLETRESRLAKSSRINVPKDVENCRVLGWLLSLIYSKNGGGDWHPLVFIPNYWMNLFLLNSMSFMY